LGDASARRRDAGAQRPIRRRRPPGTGHRDVTLYFDCPDVDAKHNHLGAKGVKSSGPKITYYKMKQLTVTDPDRISEARPNANIFH
jgi:hypothetical protein